MIIDPMIERLAFSDLDLADETLSNGNVYHKIGLRHVAVQTDCPLISTDWRIAAQNLQSECKPKPLEISEVAIELLQLVRDTLDWESVLAFINRLPDRIQKVFYVEEQRLLTKNESGDVEQAPSGLLQLSAKHEATAEKQGLIGGRYKKAF